MCFYEGAGRESNLQNHVLHSSSRVCIVPDEVFARGKSLRVFLFHHSALEHWQDSNPHNLAITES